MVQIGERVLSILMVGALLVSCAGNPSLNDASDIEHNTTNHLIGDMDDAYVSYRNRHETSPEIPGMILKMIRIHLEKKEYQLARFYCDEYRRDYPSGRRRTEVEYLRVKAQILRYRDEKDDRIAEEAQREANAFLSVYRHTPYREKIRVLLEQMRQERNRRYEELAKYYEGKGKPKAAEFYREKIRQP